jgi:hypothetical protein
MAHNVTHLGHFPSRTDAGAYRQAPEYLTNKREIHIGLPHVGYRKFWRR